MMTDVIITGEGSMYQADEQFQVAFGSGEEDIKEESSNESRQQEQQVRIKAFVPDWIRNRIVEKEIRK
jgi:hypothetical protein